MYQVVVNLYLFNANEMKSTGNLMSIIYESLHLRTFTFNN